MLDTNVVLSALLWGGPPLKLVQAAADGDLTLCTSPALMAELREVLVREQFARRLGHVHGTLEAALAAYEAVTQVAAPLTTPRVVQRDPDDDHVIAAAMAAGADVSVTGDRDLLDIGSHEGLRIMTVAEINRLLDARPSTT